MKLISIIGFASSGLVSAAETIPSDEKVTFLPDVGSMDQFDFDMYSGYVDVDTAATKQLHYVLVTSKNDMATDPLQVWFNGGPGCSSMMGVFQEHGPFVVEDGQRILHENAWSWNKNANMLYIDMPAGVGYSTCTKDCTYNDDTTAAENVVAFTNWMNKYTYFAKHNLFVSGESYGGVYVPTFAQGIQEEITKKTVGVADLVLKGFIVGNGVTDWKLDTLNAFAEMGYWHGLYDMDMYTQKNTLGCDFNLLIFPGEGTMKDGCMEWWMRFQELTAGINGYDVYRHCYLPDNGLMMYDSDNFGISKVGNEVKSYKKYYTSEDYTPWMYEGEHRERMLEMLPPCVYGSYVVDYLNRYDVRTALHIPDTTQAWTYCTDGGDFSYTRQYKGSLDVYTWFKTNAPDVKMLFYSGDTDGSVPTVGSLAWITKLGWKVTEEWSAVQYDHLPSTHAPMLAGYKQVTENLTFRSIHGCGHMAPQWKRPETFWAIYDWQAEVLKA